MVKMILNILLTRKMLKKIRPLCMFVPVVSAYRRSFDKTKCMSFLMKDQKYNKILKEVSNITKKESDSNPLYNEKYIRTKI